MDMLEKVPLFVIGLPKNSSDGEFLMLKFGEALEKSKKVLSDIIEAKIAVETQNSEGSRTHYEVRATITTAKNQIIYEESGWSILKITDKLCRNLEGRLSKHVDSRQKESIRKRGSS
jgi:ribosome-associated translation inhibitor RaiA